MINKLRNVSKEPGPLHPETFLQGHHDPSAALRG
jgi:hypothetical protein